MRVVLNHVTRLKGERICIAGIEPTELRHVRPVTPRRDPITRAWLAEGGPVQLGAVLDIGEARPRPSAPETEDHAFVTTDAKQVEILDSETYLELLDSVSDSDVVGAFGPSLRQVGRGYAIDAGMGSRSLTVVRARKPPSLAIEPWGKLRLRTPDIAHTPKLSVTDVRFVESDHKTVKRMSSEM